MIMNIEDVTVLWLEARDRYVHSQARQDYDAFNEIDKQLKYLLNPFTLVYSE